MMTAEELVRTFHGEHRLEVELLPEGRKPWRLSFYGTTVAMGETEAQMWQEAAEDIDEPAEDDEDDADWDEDDDFDDDDEADQEAVA